MKKLKNIIFVVLLSLLIVMPTVKASQTQLSLEMIGDLVLDKNPNASSFYIVGKYVFTMKYVDQEGLNAEDFMLAAQSIDLTVEDGEKIKGTKAYDKMSVYQIVSLPDDNGDVIGWYVADNLLGNNTIDDDTKFEIDYIDYQKVKEIHTVVFKDDQNEEIEKQYVVHGNKVNPPKIMEKEGYNFLGWYKDNDLINFAEQEIESDLEVKQKWEIKKVEVTFDKDNGEEVVKQSINYNEKVEEIKPNPTKEGYDFVGWFKCMDDECNNVENNQFDFQTQIKDNVKLKAKWEIKKIKVTFDKDNSEDLITETINYNEKVSRPKVNPTKLGYRFLGWFKCMDEGCSSLDSNEFNFDSFITADTKIKAKWEQIQYKVTFKAIIDGVADEDYIEGDKVVVLTYPYKLTTDKLPVTKEGYTLLGFMDDNNVSIDKDKITDRIFTRDTTITGIWQIQKFVVSFDTDGGKVLGDAIVNYGSKIISPGNAVKDSLYEYNDYEFDAWYICLDDTCSTLGEKFDFENTSIKKDIKLKAKFNNKVYTNKVAANFVDALKSDDYTVYIKENTNMVFNIINNNVLLSEPKNYGVFTDSLRKVLNVKNIDNITIEYGIDSTLVLNKESDIDTEIQSFFTKFSKVDYSEAKLRDLKDNFKIIINLVEGYTDEEDDSEDVYNVSFETNYVEVHDEEELRNNLEIGKEIIIVNNFELTSPITIKNNVVIDASNNTITSSITNNKYAFIIEAGDVVIKDLNLMIDILKPDEYEKETKTAQVLKNTVGIKVLKDAILTINNLHVKTKYELNGFNIDNQVLTASNVTVNENAAIELYGTLYGSNILYDGEIYGSPTVLAYKGTSDDVIMNLKGLYSQDRIYNVIRHNGVKESYDDLKDVVTEFTNYYKEYNHSYLAFAWYNSYKSGIYPFTFMYDENLIIPDMFKEDGADYIYNIGEDTYKLTGWKSRNFEGVKSFEDLVKVQVKNRETYYLYTNYTKQN